MFATKDLSIKHRLGLVSTNRYYKKGVWKFIGTDGWFLISKTGIDYELFANFNQEPEADWIDTQDAIKEGL